MIQQVSQRLAARTLTLAALCVGTAAFALGTAAHADVIASYDLTYLTSSTSNVTIVDDDVTASQYTANGDTSISTSKTHLIRLDRNSNNTKVATITDAIANNEYGEFAVTVDPGMQLNLSSLAINLQLTRGATGESFSVHLRSSLDNFAQDIDVATLAGDSNATVVNGAGSLDLTGAAFQGLTGTTTFRLYMVSDIGSRDEGSEYIRILPDVVLNGTTAAVPEPGTLALAGLGSVLMLVRRRNTSPLN